MSLLYKCDALWGEAEIFDFDPMVDVIRNVFYVPYSGPGNWGIFQEDGQPVRSAVDFREGILKPSEQTVDPRSDLHDIVETAPHGTYYYAGRLNPHYGHFLVNSLPRFWAIAQYRYPSTPILYHGLESPDRWFEIPFVAAIFGLIGLTARDFIRFDRPIRIQNLITPSTSFEEQKAGYRAYARLCRDIGIRICGEPSIIADPRPVYFSKSQLRSAVGVIKNEHEIENFLKSAGIEIVYPENLSFIEQVRLMSSRINIVGSSGSFLHTSIFCQNRNITCLNVTQQINSNYIIIDNLANNNAAYYYPFEIKVIEDQANILTTRYLPNATAVAEQLLTAMHAS